MKIAVYTALFADRDVSHMLKVPKNIKGYHFIPFIGPGSRRDARKLKCMPHRFLKAYDVSMWIDGCIQITADIVPVIEKYLTGANMAVVSHPGEHRKLAIYEEAERCKAFNKGDPGIINRQVAEYKKAGCPANREVVATTIIIRRHHEPDVIYFDKAWWSHIEMFSVRDQISFPFIAWSNKMKYNKIYSTHEETQRLGVLGTDWFEKVYNHKF